MDDRAVKKHAVPSMLSEQSQQASPASPADEAHSISKTRRKQAMHQLQALGEQLVGLTEAQFAQLELPDELRDALHAAGRITQHGALKRQRQYIGRLMRDIDPEPIRELIADWHGTSRHAVAMQHLAERWREQLLQDEHAFTALGGEFPGADLGHLRVLVRAVQTERAAHKPPRAFRLLYKALHELVERGGAMRRDTSGKTEHEP